MTLLSHPSLFTRLTLCFIAVSLLCTPLAAQGDPKAAARVHFEKGVQAFNERRYADAAKAFDRAYALSPAYVVLYNIGQVNVALGNSVAAVSAFDEYLRQGASSIPAARRNEVQGEIIEQMNRIGSLTIVSSPASAEIRIDGKLLGKTPLPQAVRVNAGEHTVQAVLPNRTPQIRELNVGGKTELTLEFTFEADPKVARAATASPGPVAMRANQHMAPAKQAKNQTAGAPPAPPPASPAQRPEAAPFNWLRAAGVVVAVGGVATMTVGGLQVLRGVNRSKDSQRVLAETKTPEAYDAELPNYKAGKKLSEGGWVIAGIGGGATLGGMLIALLVPDAPQAARGLTPWFTAHGGGLKFKGAW